MSNNMNDISINIIDSIIMMIENLDEPWGIKSINSEHIYMNNSARLFTNTPKNFSIEGKMDEAFPTTWSELFHELKEHDELTKIESSTTRLIEIDYWNGSSTLIPYISEKIPLLNKDKECIGILWNAKKILNINPLIYHEKKAVNILKTYQESSFFSKRELEIIFLLQQRFGSKEIAKYLNLSPITVNHKLQVIYQKMGVNSARQLIEYCKTYSLDNFIPERFLTPGVLFITK